MGRETPSATPPAPAPDVELEAVLREYMQVTARLERTHAALRDEVARLRSELASKDRELELRRRLAALGELAAGVAHEVRNPLGAIRLYSDLLRTECTAQRLEPALALLDKIEAGIQAIDAVVQDTLALAPRHQTPAACPLDRVLAQVRDAVGPVLAARRVTLASAGREDVWVQADEKGLQRVLVNLVVNAAEVSAPGQTVCLRVDGDTGHCEVGVLDEGPGLPPEVRERMFDPFFTTKPHGTGLGLTIAHRLVEAYGGRLRAGDRPGGGAEFVVTLPRVAAPRAAEPVRGGARSNTAA